MQQITTLTDDPLQTLGITLETGNTVQMALNWVPAQNGWFYSLQYGTFNAFNMRMVNSPNMIRKFRKIIPFGLACTVKDGYEIVNQSDFVSGRVSLYSLNPTDILSVEQLITVTLPNFKGDFLS